MGWTDKIKGALFEQEGDVGKKPPPSVAASAPATPVSAPSPVVASVTADAPDEKFLGVLLQTIDEASSPTWRQFATLLASLSAIIKDEKTLYQAALKAAEAQGLTVDAVTAAAAQRLELLKKEQQAFESDLANKAENNIPAKETNAEQMDREMASLQVQLDNLRRQRDALTHEISEARKRLEHSRTRFTSAQSALKTKFEQDLARLQMYAKP